MKKLFIGFQLVNFKIITSLFLVAICSFFLKTETYGQDGELQLKYLGTAGWEITDGKVIVLIDPYISRVKLGQGPSISPDDDRRSFKRTDLYESDTTLINSIVTKADFILVHHSHFDHLSDVPFIAKKTGAKVIGTETTTTILSSYGIPDEQLYTVRGGEDYQFEGFSVRIIPSIHSALGQKHYFDSRTYIEELKTPLRISDFIEGGSLMFLARFDNHKVLTMGSMNFVEREIQGLKPDILLAGVNYSRLEIYKYTERLLSSTNFPKIVIPAHWDNYRVPYGYSQEIGIERKIKPFIEEVKAASPDSKVITPIHLEPIIIKKK